MNDNSVSPVNDNCYNLSLGLGLIVANLERFS